MEVVHDIERSGFGRGIGPGVYDIHSPRVPSVDEVTELLRDRAGVDPGAPALGQPGLRAEDPRLRRDRRVAEEHARGDPGRAGERFRPDRLGAQRRTQTAVLLLGGMHLAAHEIGTGPRTAVLIHGIMSDHRAWHRVSAELVAQGFRVDHGRPGRPRCESAIAAVFACGLGG